MTGGTLLIFMLMFDNFRFLIKVFTLDSEQEVMIRSDSERKKLVTPKVMFCSSLCHEEVSFVVFTLFSVVVLFSLYILFIWERKGSSSHDVVADKECPEDTSSSSMMLIACD